MPLLYPDGTPVPEEKRQRAQSPNPLSQPKKMKLKMRDAQDRCIAMLADGSTVAQAMKALGYKNPTLFYDWCRRYPWFDEKANKVRKRDASERTQFENFRLAHFGFPTPWHQKQIIDAIENGKPRSITMILLWPGAGKTTCMEDYYCYRLAYNPDDRISVVTETQDLGRKMLSRVTRRMLDPDIAPTYIDQFGPFKAEDRNTSKPWNADYFSLARSHADQREYSFEVRGAGKKIYGVRCDLMVLDDIQSVTSARSPMSTPNLVEYFIQDVMTRVESTESGRIIIVGTRVGSRDFYDALLRADMVDTLVKLPICDPETEEPTNPKHTLPIPHNAPPGTKPKTWGEDKEDIERLKRQTKGSPEVWARVYMQNPTSKIGATFTETMMNEAKDLTLGVDPKADRMGTFRVAALDPALSGRAVFRVADINYDSLILRDGDGFEELGNYDEIYKQIGRFSQLWHPQVWIIEQNAFQGGLLRSPELLTMSKKFGFTIEPHATFGNKTDELIGVPSMAQSFLMGQIKIPWGTAEAREKFEQLPVELLNWRVDVPTKMLRQDEVMCLWFLHLWWFNNREALAQHVESNIQTKHQLRGYTHYRSARI